MPDHTTDERGRGGLDLGALASGLDLRGIAEAVSLSDLDLPGSFEDALAGLDLDGPSDVDSEPGPRAAPGGSDADIATARALADRFGLPFTDLGTQGVDAQAAGSIPVSLLERVGALPFRLHDGRLTIAVSDPRDVQSLDELRLSTRQAIEFTVAVPGTIRAELRRMGRAQDALERTSFVDVDIIADEDDFPEEIGADTDVNDAPLGRLVNSIMLRAAEDGASDIHFDPTEDAIVVRYRVDGVLQEVQRVPRRLGAGISTLIKVLAKLDIAQRRIPQDGRISITARQAGRDLDVRVAILPTVEGESVVMRLLDKSRRAPTLTELGFPDRMRASLESIIARPTGALLVTGPTGSGKSTTLYAGLTELSTPQINVITVEDPVEYRLAGVNQVQINPRAGLTFASALRSILRCDPDAIMVGEIRDGETAKISIESALTGHFVLSTLHTNDAPAAISRLSEMGVEPFLTSAAVTAVVAQRLARRLCLSCRLRVRLDGHAALSAGFGEIHLDARGGIEIHRPAGCPECNQTGYRGRQGIFQLMEMNGELKELTARNVSHEHLERAALENGMQTLWQAGLDAVAAGVTSIEEIGRVLV